MVEKPDPFDRLNAVMNRSWIHRFFDESPGGEDRTRSELLIRLFRSVQDSFDRDGLAEESEPLYHNLSHCIEVAEFSLLLAEGYRLDHRSAYAILTAAILHDLEPGRQPMQSPQARVTASSVIDSFHVPPLGDESESVPLQQYIESMGLDPGLIRCLILATDFPMAPEQAAQIRQDGRAHVRERSGDGNAAEDLFTTMASILASSDKASTYLQTPDVAMSRIRGLASEASADQESQQESDEGFVVRAAELASLWSSPAFFELFLESCNNEVFQIQIQTLLDRLPTDCRSNYQSRWLSVREAVFDAAEDAKKKLLSTVQRVRWIDPGDQNDLAAIMRWISEIVTKWKRVASLRPEELMKIGPGMVIIIDGSVEIRPEDGEFSEILGQGRLYVLAEWATLKACEQALVLMLDDRNMDGLVPSHSHLAPAIEEPLTAYQG
jgi:hypothetical protein